MTSWPLIRTLLCRIPGGPLHLSGDDRDALLAVAPAELGTRTDEYVTIQLSQLMQIVVVEKK